MKYSIIYLSLFFFLAPNAHADSTNVGAQKALAAIKAEPKVKDATYDPEAAVQWHAGVLPDGTERHGYAGYLCEVLREHGVVSPDTWGRVVDSVKIKKGSSFSDASLGRVNCKTYEKRSP